MGRKIPAKKHRGVKDPLLQQAKRAQSLKNKINAPPTDPDDQPLPKSLTRLFSFKSTKVGNKKIKKSKKQSINEEANEKASLTYNPVSSLRRLTGESGRAFSLRINSAMRTLSAPDSYDYVEDMESEDTKGDAMTERREKRARKRARGGAAGAGRGDAGAGRGDAGAPDKLTRGQKLTLRKKARKLNAAQERAREAALYERPRFGEVAAAPPALPAPRRAPHNLHRPRRDLLLYGLLAGGGSAGGAAAGGPAGAGAGGGAGGAAGERARLAAVAAYRALKAQRPSPPILTTL